mmetsp:Transcript_24728/g.44551  ORF Transcript_24728/g.44551 Transcript_24728/m.44551 type:complete len:203 (+) Transcript_24728:2676-3284(+)
MFMPMSSSFPRPSSLQQLGPRVQMTLVLRGGTRYTITSFRLMAVVRRLRVFSVTWCRYGLAIPGATLIVTMGMPSASGCTTPCTTMTSFPGLNSLDSILWSRAFSIKTSNCTTERELGRELTKYGTTPYTGAMARATEGTDVTRRMGTRGRYLATNNAGIPVLLTTTTKPAFTSRTFLAAQPRTASRVLMGFSVKLRIKSKT